VSDLNSPLEKVAILLLSLGEDLAGEILQKLPRADAQKIVQTLIRLRNVDRNIVQEIQEEFQGLLATKDKHLPDGASFAKQLIKNRFDPNTASKLMESIPSEIPKSFREAELVDSKQLYQFLNREHPQTIALILGHLSPKKSGEIVGLMHPQVRSDVLLRLATLQEVDEKVLAELDQTLSQLLAEARRSVTRKLGGPTKTAQILTFLSAQQRNELMTQMESKSIELANEVRAGLFTFDDIIKLDRQDVEKLIAKVSPQDLELALRKCTEAVANLFFSAMSERRAEQFRENIASTKPVPIVKVAESQRRIAALASEMIASGHLRDPMEEAV
jgi:flagellar motor switch protein FliG